MNATRSPRWLMSFADLCLLLLGFFVLLHARADGHGAAASVRAAFGGKAGTGSTIEQPATLLFEPGEAVLRQGEARRLAAFGAALRTRPGHVRVASRGSASATGRFDGWELAAARTAAVARAVAAGGIDPQRIEIDLPQGRAGSAGPQRLSVGPA